MAKLCMTQRETKRLKMVEKFKAKRLALNEVINDSSATREQKIEARQKLQTLPRNSSPVRLRTRCALTGRPRGVYKKFGLARGKLRDLMMAGEVPGVVKASW
jgi:small subunit ribosomal protein S14